MKIPRDSSRKTIAPHRKQQKRNEPLELSVAHKTTSHRKVAEAFRLIHKRVRYAEENRTGSSEKKLLMRDLRRGIDKKVSLRDWECHD
jgi:hypothetical protein